MEDEREDGREFKALHFLLLRYVVCCWAKTDLLRVGSGKAGSFPCCVPTKCSGSWKKTPKLIIGQARKECCLSDRRFAVGLQGCRMISSATDLPELLHCCFSVLALSEAVMLMLCEYMKGTAETGSYFERKSVISALSWSQYELYVTSNLYSFSLVCSWNEFCPV